MSEATRIPSAIDFAVTFSEPVTGVDAADFQVAKTGTIANTSLTVTGSGATYTVTVAASPPQMVSVTPNGSIPSLAGNQRSRVASLVVVFNQPVQLDANAFMLSLHTNNVTVNGEAKPAGYGELPASLDWTSTDNISWTVTFVGNTETGADGVSSLKDGVYDFTIDGAKVHPLGAPNVAMGATQATTVHRLFGDAAGAAAFQAIVNSADNLAFRNAFNKPADGGYQAFLDFNGDGMINSADNLQFRSRFNKLVSWQA